MIPKIIHRFWESNNNTFPDINTELGQCFYSQNKLQEYGYEIKTYNSKNFDMSKSKYLAQAYALKKWAFVSDYIRLYQLYHEGGIWLDTDVEVINTFDKLLHCKYFVGAVYNNWTNKELDNGKNFPAINYFTFDGGVIGCEKHNKFIGLILDFYNNYNFIEDDGFIHDKYIFTENRAQDFIELKISGVLQKYNYNTYLITNNNNLSNYINTVNNSDQSKEVYILNTEFLGDINYYKHENKNAICIHKKLGSWIKNSYEKLTDYSEEEQKEYYVRFNEIYKL